MTTEISRFIILGDSLSDRGTLNRRRLGGLIPMNVLAGLAGRVPNERFTNGIVWDDVLIHRYVQKIILHRLDNARSDELKKLDELIKQGSPTIPLVPIKTPDDMLADAVKKNIFTALEEELKKYPEDGGPIWKALLEINTPLTDDMKIEFGKTQVLRSFAEGGATAHSYTFADLFDADGPASFWNNLVKAPTRAIVSNLTEKRELLLEDDKENATSGAQKAKTLVIEWSGANDLVTVNNRPSHGAADKAIAARMQNIRELYSKGYRHFALCNLPDLSLTPRYQALDQAEQINAKEVSNYFNTKLNEEYTKLQAELQQEDPTLSIKLFDIHAKFYSYYNDDSKGFDLGKRTTYLQKAREELLDKIKNNKELSPEELKLKERFLKGELITDDMISGSEHYLFDDDLHPSARLHQLLASEIFKEMESEYEFVDTKTLPIQETEMVTQFIDEYKKLHPLVDEKTINTLQKILHKIDDNSEIFDIFKTLKWIDLRGNINPAYIPLIEACKKNKPDCLHEGEYNQYPAAYVVGSLAMKAFRDALLGGLGGAAVGAIIGSVVPVIGTVVGAIAGFFLGEFAGLVVTGLHGLMRGVVGGKSPMVESFATGTLTTLGTTGLGAIIGTFIFPGIGTAIGAGVGAFAGLIPSIITIVKSSFVNENNRNTTIPAIHGTAEAGDETPFNGTNPYKILKPGDNQPQIDATPRNTPDAEIPVEKDNADLASDFENVDSMEEVLQSNNPSL